MSEGLAGILVVDKPAGMTSFDVVRRVRRAARVRRVGHGGTLDPLASGVLPVCLGEATKVLQFLLDADKEYEVTACLGVETDTLDAAGTITARADATGIDEAAVRAALPAFTGLISQAPPAYSAIKRQGRPLYAYARAGEAVTVAPRAVTVHELALTGWAGPGAVALRVRCSKGTYVRSLVADLGRALGPGGHVTALRRTRSGPFTIGEALPLAEVEGRLEATAETLPLVRPEAALGHLPRCFVDEALARELAQGKRVSWQSLVGPPAAADLGERRICVLRRDGGLVAVAERQGQDGVRTLRVFARG
jgi:tRNA pseudouridine55 synthase